MADNVAVTPGTGASIATDDIVGIQYQRVKLTQGADGVNDGDVSATNPMHVRISDGTDIAAVVPLGTAIVSTNPGIVTNSVMHGLSTGGGGAYVDVKVSPSGAVQIGGTLDANSGVDIGDVTINNAAGVSAVNVQDGGNSITVDGTVAFSNTTIAVTNTGTFATQVDGAALTALQILNDAVVADDAAFTPATTKVMMAGFTFDDVIPDSVNEGDAGAARMSANRSQYVNIRDNAGNERGLNVAADGSIAITVATVPSHAVTNVGTFAVQESGAALTALQLIDNAISGAGFNITQFAGVNNATGSGLSTGALRVELPTNGTGVIATVGAVTAITNALPAGTNAIGKLAANSGVDIGDVDVTSIIPGTAATNLGKAVDAVAGATDTGVATLAIRDDALTALTPIDGDYTNQRTNARGATWMAIEDGAGGQITSFGGGTQYTEDAVAAADPVGTVPILVRADTPAAIASANGDNVAQRGTNYGAAYVQLVTSTGSLIDSLGGGTQYTEDAIAAADPVGTAPILVRADTPATITSANGDNVAQRCTNYGAAFTQIVSSTGSFVDTFGGGTQYAEGATAATITGTAMMMEGASNVVVPAQGTIADGMLVNLGANNDVTVTGTVTITPSGTQTVAGNKTNNNAAPGATNIGALVGVANAAAPTHTEGNQVAVRTNLAGDLAITLDGEAVVLGAGTAGIGKLTANSGVTIGAVEIAAAQTLGTVSTVTNLSQMGGVAIALNTGVRSTGTMRVTIATDDLVPVVGAVAHDAAISGNPVRQGLRALTSDFTAVAAGDTVDAASTILGKQIVMPYALPGASWRYVGAAGGIVNTTPITLVGAGGANVKQYVSSISLINSHQTIGTEIVIRNSTTTATTLYRAWCQFAGGGVAINFSPPLASIANEGLEILEVTATGTAGVVATIDGYTDAE